MADKKVSSLTELISPIRGDLLYVIDDPLGIPTSKKVTVENILRGREILVAANDASDTWKKSADYVCDGVNDQVEIQAAIDAISSPGGRVLTSPGTFLLSYAETISVGIANVKCSLKITRTHPNISLEGIPGATIFKIADNQVQDRIVTLVIFGTSAVNLKTNQTYVSGIEFDNNIYNQTTYKDGYAIDEIFDTGETIIEKCRFKNWHDENDPFEIESWAVHIRYKTRKTTIQNNYFLGESAMRLDASYCTVSKNIFENNIEALAKGAVDLTADFDVDDGNAGNQIVNNLFIGGQIQVYINGTQNSLISGNVFINQMTTGHSAVYSSADDGGGGWDSKNNSIIGNLFYNCCNGVRMISTGPGTHGNLDNIVALNQFVDGPDRNLNYAVLSTGAASGRNIIAFNFLSTVGQIYSTAAGDVVYGNSGYVTEAKGATSVADGGTILHGCETTPTVVEATPSVAGEMVSVTARAATTFTVAIKKPDGSAGTTQTVYWRAYV
jgi:hypothetical protein